MLHRYPGNAIRITERCHPDLYGYICTAFARNMCTYKYINSCFGDTKIFRKFVAIKLIKLSLKGAGLQGRFRLIIDSEGS
jgi:hypothetical protein